MLSQPYLGYRHYLYTSTEGMVIPCSLPGLVFEVCNGLGNGLYTGSRFCHGGIEPGLKYRQANDCE